MILMAPMPLLEEERDVLRAKVTMKFVTFFFSAGVTWGCRVLNGVSCSVVISQVFRFCFDPSIALIRGLSLHWQMLRPLD